MRPKRRNCVCSASNSEEGGLKKTPTITFSYLSQELADQMDLERQDARQKSLREYEDLKELLLTRTWRFGTLFAVYLLLTVSAESAFAELVGAAASYGYFLWLIRDVDAYTADTPVPMRAAEMVEPAFARNIAKLFAAYRNSLNPRLLVPVGLVAGCAAWNAAFPDFHLGIVEQGCLLGGFVSYKIALVLKIYDDLKPRALTDEEMLQMSRPQLPEVEDVPLNLKRPSEIKAEEEAEAAAEGQEKQGAAE